MTSHSKWSLSSQLYLFSCMYSSDFSIAVKLSKLGQRQFCHKAVFYTNYSLCNEWAIPGVNNVCGLSIVFTSKEYVRSDCFNCVLKWKSNTKQELKVKKLCYCLLWMLDIFTQFTSINTLTTLQTKHTGARERQLHPNKTKCVF